MDNLQVKSYDGRKLSCFRTYNFAKFYADISTAQQAIEAFEYTRKNNLNPFVLGAGSNVFFKNTNIKSFVLKNNLEKKIKYLGDDRFLVSSSVRMIELLNHLYKESRDACYYLASAPCEVGGAIAMNAGTGPKEAKAIFDFIESVKFVKNGEIFDLKADDIEHSHRKTQLSENSFILSAICKFPKTTFETNPIKKRLQWAKENQDLSVPNCGSLCNRYDANLMKFTRFLFSLCPAGMSKKKLNWTYNKSDNPIYLRYFLNTLKALHKVFRKPLKLEIKIVD